MFNESYRYMHEQELELQAYLMMLSGVFLV